jgi:hypothetical protein
MDLKDKYTRLIILGIVVMVASIGIVAYSVYVSVSNVVWIGGLIALAGSATFLFIVVDKKDKSKLEKMVE